MAHGISSFRTARSLLGRFGAPRASFVPSGAAAANTGRDLRLTRLSVEDLDNIALRLRLQGMRGDLNAGLVADALDSVVQRRHAAQMARHRSARHGVMSSAWQRVTAWATIR